MKNKKIIIALALVIAILIVVIGVLLFKVLDKKENQSDNSNQSTEATAEPNNTEKPTEQPTIEPTATSKEEKRDLTVSELKEFEKYFNDLENNGFLLTDYNNPKQLSLYDVLYSNSIAKSATQEELKAYLKAIGFDDEDFPTACHKYKKSDIEKLLKEKADILLSDVKMPEEFTYIAEFDAYFHGHGDMAYMNVEVKSGKIDENGMYIIVYTMEQHEKTVTMKKVDNNYLFVSNIDNTQIQIDNYVKSVREMKNLKSISIDNYTMYYQEISGAPSELCYVVDDSSIPNGYVRRIYYKDGVDYIVSIEEDGKETADLFSISENEGIKIRQLFENNVD